MTVYLKCIDEKLKDDCLAKLINAVRQGSWDPRVFYKDSSKFKELPGASFSYWAPDTAIQSFLSLPTLESPQRIARSTNDSGDDMRFIRATWEVAKSTLPHVEWRPVCKGGPFNRYYADVHLAICWNTRRDTYLGFVGSKHRPLEKPASIDLFLRPGLTWSRRTALPLSVRAMPSNCLFAQKGPAIFAKDDERSELLCTLAIVNSAAFFYFVEFQLGAVKAGRAYDMGVIQRSPFPNITPEQRNVLAGLAHRAWSLKRTIDTTEETSHAFLLPSALRARLGDYDISALEAELDSIQAEIDSIAFDLYNFSEADRAAVQAGLGAADSGDSEECLDEDGDDEESATPVDQTAGLLSWAGGVAFGRFDWRLASDERAAPPEPDPFDPLPAKSPGMLQEGSAPFHFHAGILVDDPGHPHDLARLIEEVLARVEAPVPADVRRWMQRDFFAFHLQRYSKSRRRAPIYWPLSTPTGSYTLWVYYPSLTSQTLYTAVNDFVEVKLQQVGADVAMLRSKGSARTRDDERQFEAMQAFELELIELRDTLLKLAPSYKPDHDDGVQISAAPLWTLFRHKPWQKVLRDTWAKLEKGDYDWAHLAMTYWPERVREKCKTDKSLAITHGLEHLYVESEAPPKMTRGRKKGGRR